MKIKIDDNIPLTSATSEPLYPYIDLQVGQSFFAPGKTPGSISPHTQRAVKSSGFTFRTRTVTEKGVAGCRVWRTE